MRAWRHGIVGTGCYEQAMADRCRACLADLEHCHGTLIRHRLRTSECTDDGCTDTEVVRHAFAVDCDEVGCGCPERALLAV